MIKPVFTTQTTPARNEGESWDIEASHPQDYLTTLYEMAPLEAIGKIGEIAGRRGIDKMDFLLRLGKSVPNYSRKVIEDLDPGQITYSDNNQPLVDTSTWLGWIALLAGWK